MNKQKMVMLAVFMSLLTGCGSQSPLGKLLSKKGNLDTSAQGECRSNDDREALLSLVKKCLAFSFEGKIPVDQFVLGGTTDEDLSGGRLIMQHVYLGPDPDRAIYKLDAMAVGDCDSTTGKMGIKFMHVAWVENAGDNMRTVTRGEVVEANLPSNCNPGSDP